MSSRRGFYQKAHSYIVYYGTGNVHKLAHYDIAIIEPSAYSAQEVKVLKAANTLVLGYVSIMELGDFHKMYGQLKDEDFLRIKGEKFYKPEFQTYVLDLKSKHWQGLLSHHVGRLLLHEGYDGIFMDTIGDVEAPNFPPVESDLQIVQAVHMLRRYRSLFPDHVFVQNNGLERLCLQTAKYLDGICWENPPFTLKQSAAWCQSVLDQIIELKMKFGVRALFLNEADEIINKPAARVMAQSLADKHGFLYYEAPDYLTVP